MKRFSAWRLKTLFISTLDFKVFKRASNERPRNSFEWYFNHSVIESNWVRRVSFIDVLFLLNWEGGTLWEFKVRQSTNRRFSSTVVECQKRCKYYPRNLSFVDRVQWLMICLRALKLKLQRLINFYFGIPGVHLKHNDNTWLGVHRSQVTSNATEDLFAYTAWIKVYTSISCLKIVISFK